MTGKGVSSISDSRLRWMVGAQLFWLGMVCVLGAWWGRLVLVQASRIADLETALGLGKIVTQNHWQRTQRMLYWESSFFFGLLLACTALLFWLYWRDVKRTRGLQVFFASVTHELRTPLTSIRLQAESIAETFEGEDLIRNSTSENSRRIFRLLEDTIRLEAQVEKTLELARIEGGGPVHIQLVELRPWLERFLKTWEYDYKNKVEFQQNIEDVLIEADSAAIHVIFKNLLENSVRHSKKIRVLISISVVQSDNGVLVLLKDNGQGFLGDQATLGKIFQKGPQSQGTGVGLYLVKVLMDRMGGWVKFSLNSGFEVRLWFRESREGSHNE